MTTRPICRTADIPAGGMKECELEDGQKVLVANSGDHYFACQAICPHQDVPLCEGLFDGNVLTCHQHLWQWDIRTGAAIGLAEAPLERYDVRVENGEIFVGDPGEVPALNLAELFAGVAPATLEALQRLVRREEVPGGKDLYQVGDPVADLYVLESGRVEFRIGRGDQASPAGFMLRKGELFGWAALLENQPFRIAKAVCLEPSVVLRLDGAAVLGVLKGDPASGFIVMRRLSSLIARQMSGTGAT